MSRSAAFSVYVHLPFCAHKCPYCDFNTYAVPRIPEREYVDALCVELARYRDDPRFVGREVKSIFFGGGTPSLLSEGAVSKVIDRINSSFPIIDRAEVTLEANPNDGESAKLAGFKSAGVNRVSFGVQSFDNQRLQILGRNHSADEAITAIERAAQVGISNISLDLIFGVPNQSVTELESDLNQALALPIRHLSTYSLTIEPGTPFYQRQARGLLTMPPDERVALMLERIPELALARGFKRYEISNYALPGSESVHNMAYWSGGDYIGIGAGAHSYSALYGAQGAIEFGERWSNLALPQSYIEAANKGSAVSWRETLDRPALKFEFFYLGLRRTELGVSEQEYKNLFGEPFSGGVARYLNEREQDGLIEYHRGRARLTLRGVALADSVFEGLAGEADHH
jgi:oxygen-independent coproporphyrinogen-3 oxidase